MELIKFILEFMVLAIRKMAIFFIIGISFAALIKTFNLDKYLSKSLERKKLISVPLATMAGAFSPLCSCGVIPAIAALLISGVPLAPIMAFWVTSPLMNPETFALTYGILGKEIALARLVSTVFIGLLGGYITFFLSKKGFLDGPIIKEYTNVDKNIGINCCKDKKVRKSLVFIRNFKDMALFVGKYLVLAFFLEALIVRFIPFELVSKFLGISNPFGPIIAALIGIPAYTSGISSIPIIRGLVEAGMDKGTALTFMLSGGATSIPAMVAVFSIVKKRIFLLYILISMFSSIFLGYIYRMF